MYQKKNSLISNAIQPKNIFDIRKHLLPNQYFFKYNVKLETLHIILITTFFYRVPQNDVLQNKIRVVAYIKTIVLDIKSNTEIHIGVFKTNVGKNKSDIRFICPSSQSNIKI